MTGLPAPGAPDAVYVLDLHCWVHRFHATTGSWAARNFLDFVTKLLFLQRPTYFAVCGDLRAPTFRHALMPRREAGDGYKQNRKPVDGSVLEQIRVSKELLDDICGFQTIVKKGFEADDLIAAIVQQAKAAGMRAVVLGLDKDLMQLVDDACVMWDGKQKVVGPTEVQHKFGVQPAQVRDYLAICGDTVDNVPGVKGLGPGAARKILTEFWDLPEALQKAEDEPKHRLWGAHPAYRKHLREQREQAELSRKLVTLADDCINIDFEEIRFSE